MYWTLALAIVRSRLSDAESGQDYFALDRLKLPMNERSCLVIRVRCPRDRGTLEANHMLQFTNRANEYSYLFKTTVIFAKMTTVGARLIYFPGAGRVKIRRTVKL